MILLRSARFPVHHPQRGWIYVTVPDNDVVLRRADGLVVVLQYGR